MRIGIAYVAVCPAFFLFMCGCNAQVQPTPSLDVVGDGRVTLHVAGMTEALELF